MELFVVTKKWFNKSRKQDNLKGVLWSENSLKNMERPILEGEKIHVIRKKKLKGRKCTGTSVGLSLEAGAAVEVGAVFGGGGHWGLIASLVLLGSSKHNTCGYSYNSKVWNLNDGGGGVSP